MTEPDFVWPEAWSRTPSPHAEWVRIGELGALAPTLPRPCVLVNGCFDLLHTGHLMMLMAARYAVGGGAVVMALDGDERIRQAKGAGRPLLSWIERATQLSWTGLVDYLVEFGSDDEFRQIYDALQPQARVQGAQYKGLPSLTEPCPTIWVPHLSSLSSTEIVQRAIRSSARTEEVE